MTGPAVVLDACVLMPIRLATTVLWLAEARLFQPLWTDQILDEVERNLPKVGVDPGHAARRVAMMREAFGSEALVGDYERLVHRMECDPKDRHVLAAAVAGGADGLLTFNVKDFPGLAVEPWRIEVLHPDEFLTGLLREQSETVMAVLEAEVASFRNPHMSTTAFLEALSFIVPGFAREAIGDGS